MRSRLTLNLILLVVIAVLGAVAYFKPGKETPPVTPLLTLDTGALTRFTLQNAETAVFEKQDGQWRLTAPFAAPVNAIRLGQLLDIASAASEAQYPLKPEDLAQFGLDKPQATLTLGDTVLQFGGTDPINFRRYVKLGDTLHLVNDSFFHHLTAPPTDYVDKKLLPDSARVTGIELPGLKATKSPEGPWTAEPPDAAKTDLGELASAWATARAIDVKRLDGKDLPGDTIRITLAAGPPVEFVIQRQEPDLILARKDWGLQYEITAEIARELLHQPKPPPASQPAAANQPHSDDDEHDDENGESGGDEDNDRD